MGMHAMAARWGLAAAVAVALTVGGLAATGCSSGSKPPPVVAPPPAKPAPKPLAERGAACAASDADPSGGCAAGMMCAPVPGGYCMSFCGVTGTDCPEGGACIDTGRGGEMCARACNADEDCRVEEGYVCDPDWKACVLPGLTSPKLPVCELAGDATPPAKKAFGPAHQISTASGPGTYHFEPTAALDKAGNLVALFIAGTGMGKPNPLSISVVGTDGAIEPDQELTSERENHFDPWMAADRAGTLHAVWLGFDGGRAPEKRSQIAYATSADGGGTWSKAVAVHNAATDCPDEAPGCLDKPMIAIGPEPKKPRAEVIYVLYDSAITGGMRLVASRDGGKSFGSSVAVTPGTYGDVEVGADGAIHVAAVEGSPQAGFGSMENRITYTVSTDGGKTFAAPVPVSAEGESVPFFFVNPNVVVDARRRTIYVVYAHGAPDGAWDIVLAASRDGGKKWTRTRVNDDDECANQMVPNAVLDPKTGKVHVTWSENRAGSGRLAYAVCEPGGKKCGANEAVSDAPFAAYALVRHSSKWIGEYGALLIDSKRRVLHAVWTQPIDEKGRPIARIFHAAARLR